MRLISGRKTTYFIWGRISETWISWREEFKFLGHLFTPAESEPSISKQLDMRHPVKVNCTGVSLN